VIVISDGGDRASFPDLSEFRETLNLRVIHIPHGGPAGARNRGLEAARGTLVAFIDDDCLPGPGWLGRIVAAASTDPPVAAGGRTRNGIPSNPYASAYQLVLDMAELDQRRRNYGPLFFPSNNLAFPAEALRRLGGFNPEFRTAEDREICRRWLEAGYRLAHAPDALVFHAPELDAAALWRRFFSYGKGAAQFHAGSGGQWIGESLAFHLRVPALAASVIREQRLGRAVTLAALVGLWEIANLTGYLMQILNLGPGIRTGEGRKGAVR
jgi:cellulose synthase/poly-beta-1,6-N-acetylglucosamine synthase-like glycosyltransferase